MEDYQAIKDILEEVVKLSTAFIKTNKSWREHAKFYNELEKVITLIPYPLYKEFFEQIVPNLDTVMKSGNDKLKNEASLLLATLIFNMPNQTK